MESVTSNQNDDHIEVVERFGSEGDLLDDKFDKPIKRQKSFNKSCGDINKTTKISQKLSLDDDPRIVRTRTESTSSVPCSRPKTMGYFGQQKEYRKTNTLRKKMDKLRRKTTGVTTNFQMS